MKASIVTLCLIAGCASVRAVGSAASEQDPSPEQLLALMARTYQMSRSYRDTGVATITLPFGTEERPFRTAFVRPDKFRFEFADRGKRYILWRSGSQVRTWWDLDRGVQTADSLELAVAGATGVSGRTAHTIPALLMPNEIGGRRLFELSGLSRLPDDVVGPKPCYRIQGHVAGSTQTIWLEKSSYLVRRIEEILPPGLGTRTTVYHPVLNDSIADDLLAFNPEKR
jgi:outer membrane lipoprotein-sorting protein